MFERFVVFLGFMLSLFACDEGPMTDDDAVSPSLAAPLSCVVYVDSMVTADGDGSSWSHALKSLEAAQEKVDAMLETRERCEIKARGQLTNAETFLASYNGRVTLTDAQDTQEELPESVEEEYDLRSVCSCDTFSGRVEMTNNTDATGTPGTGVLEIYNQLRIDNNEVITNTGTTLYLQNDNNGDVKIDGNTVVIDASENRVGIGVPSPNETLDVNGTIKVPSGTISSWTTNYENGIDLESYAVGVKAKDFKIKDQNNVYFAGFDTNRAEFEVQGTIFAEEIVVESDLADYVFQDGYDLKSIEEVESYIKENNRLPNMPSESDVDSNGLSLGDFNNLLLQKIEELTLHVIEQNNKIKKLEKQIATVK